jgi:hypothetical protein
VTGAREGSRIQRLTVVLGLGLLLPAVVLADWLAPDPSYRDAMMQLRYATRDTAGHPGDMALVDTLATALLRVGPRPAAVRARRSPGDPSAPAASAPAMGDQNARAESPLVPRATWTVARRSVFRRACGSRSGRRGGDERSCRTIWRKPPARRRTADGDERRAGAALFDKIWPAPLVKVKLTARPC